MKRTGECFEIMGREDIYILKKFFTLQYEYGLGTLVCLFDLTGKCEQKRQ